MNWRLHDRNFFLCSILVHCSQQSAPLIYGSFYSYQFSFRYQSLSCGRVAEWSSIGKIVCLISTSIFFLWFVLFHSECVILARIVTLCELISCISCTSERRLSALRSVVVFTSRWEESSHKVGMTPCRKKISLTLADNPCFRYIHVHLPHPENDAKYIRAYQSDSKLVRMPNSLPLWTLSWCLLTGIVRKQKKKTTFRCLLKVLKS